MLLTFSVFIFWSGGSYIKLQYNLKDFKMYFYIYIVNGIHPKNE